MSKKAKLSPKQRALEAKKVNNLNLKHAKILVESSSANISSDGKTKIYNNTKPYQPYSIQDVSATNQPYFQKFSSRATGM